ncbi:hypothetical protein, partial [Escherichia coli]|uniref:hypothetical protein n=1 Tax=Escherichia coli TaxID=562 RepID=UPI003F8D6B25
KKKKIYYKQKLEKVVIMIWENAAKRLTGKLQVVSWLCEYLLDVNRTFPTVLGWKERFAWFVEAARLGDALGVRLPESLPEIYLHRVSYPLRDIFLRYLRA